MYDVDDGSDCVLYLQAFNRRGLIKACRSAIRVQYIKEFIFHQVALASQFIFYLYDH